MACHIHILNILTPDHVALKLQKKLRYLVSYTYDINNSGEELFPKIFKGLHCLPMLDIRI